MKYLATTAVLIVTALVSFLTFANAANAEGKARLPKTQEEYRLTVLWMKAVEEKDFDKAETLRKQVKEEQFKNASLAEQIRMVREAREEFRLDTVRMLGNADTYINTVATPAGVVVNVRKFREELRKSREEEDKKLAMLIAEMEARQETLTRERLLEAELEALKSIKDEAQLEKRVGELIGKWEAEDKARSKALDDELDRLVAVEAQSRKPKESSHSLQ